MTENQLSKRAQKTLALIREGRFYKAFANDKPACMQELVDAGLVGVTMRVEVIVACYVPTTGYTPYVPEKYDSAEKYDT